MGDAGLCRSPGGRPVHGLSFRIFENVSQSMLRSLSRTHPTRLARSHDRAILRVHTWRSACRTPRGRRVGGRWEEPAAGGEGARRCEQGPRGEAASLPLPRYALCPLPVAYPFLATPSPSRLPLRRSAQSSFRNRNYTASCLPLCCTATPPLSRTPFLLLLLLRFDVCEAHGGLRVPFVTPSPAEQGGLTTPSPGPGLPTSPSHCTAYRATALCTTRPFYFQSNTL